MTCKHCSKDNRPEAKYCRFCGEPLEAEESAQKGLIGKDAIIPVLGDLDRKLKEALEELDVVSKAALMELLESYVQKGDLDVLKSELKEWANARFMRKMFLTQSAYDALEEKEENVLYCII
jgi:predicted amidophosphoribosyltransferase